MSNRRLSSGADFGWSLSLTPCIWLLAVLVAGRLDAAAHETITHQTIMDFAATNAGLLPTPLVFTSTQSTRMREGALDEDNGTRSLNHAFNPMTDGAFPLGTTARDTALVRWNSVASAFAAGSFDGGDAVGAWHFLGRASHFLQDMASPLHSFAVQHAVPSCQFEGYWGAHDPELRTILPGLGGPLHSSTLPPEATAFLDGFTAGRLQDRFNTSCPHKNDDDIRGWIETQVWATYFRATFWGEVIMGSSWGDGQAAGPMTTTTTFADGTVGPQANTLNVMFNGNVRWINNFIGDDYYELTDRAGNVFRYMSITDIDDWGACGRTLAGGWAPGVKDSSILVGGSDDDDDGVRVTGRFWFDLRELGRSTSGSFNRYCYPNKLPDGTPTTDHLHQYLGRNGDRLAARYNAGLLGLANRRVTVRTGDPESSADFSWSRQDNFARGPSFSAGDSGTHFYFVAKSAVTLTAPLTNANGGAFLHWLQDGAPFAGNANRVISINTATDWIPQAGVVYTAEFVTTAPTLEAALLGQQLVLSWPSNAGDFILESATQLAPPNWSTNEPPAVLVNGQFVLTNTLDGPMKFFRLKK